MEKDLPSNLRAFRELRGLTQADLAARAGMRAAAISHFETGQRTPSVESLVKLADALELRVDVLLGRAPVESTAQLDPLFLQASRATSGTLERVRRVLTALLADEGPQRVRKSKSPSEARSRQSHQLSKRGRKGNV